MKALKPCGHGLLLALSALAFAQPGQALQWSNTELQLQYGNLDVPTFAGGGDATHLIYTFQHASGWTYGDNFMFVDVLDAQRAGFQDFDVYGEWYSNFSLGKITGKALGGGVVSDIGLIVGINYAADAKVRKYASGVRLALDLPGFAFANLDTMALFDDSEGAAAGGAPKEDDTFIIDFNFMRPFKIGASNFSVEGHVEYIHGRDNEFGGRSKSWILAQPQLRWHPTDQVALGIEYQFWMNKLGDGATDEHAVQALLVWKF